jgi:hypothetical protein
MLAQLAFGPHEEIVLEPLGDFNTLSERLRAEVAASNSATPLPALVSA